MTTIVAELDPEKTKKAILFFEDKEVLKPTNEYEFFRCKLHEHTVVVYTSGKVVISGENPEHELLLINNKL